jgi:hypothetical protein
MDGFLSTGPAALDEGPTRSRSNNLFINLATAASATARTRGTGADDPTIHRLSSGFPDVSFSAAAR